MNEINSEMVSEIDHLSVESQKGQVEPIESNVNQIYKDLEIIEVPISNLKVHPINIILHGDNPKIIDLLVSIPKYGIRIPLLINPNKEIIDGRRRYKALQILGWESVPCVIDPELTESDKTFERILVADQQKDQSPEYIYIASKMMEEMESERAKQRMLRGKSPLVDEGIGRTDANIAKFFNIGRTTLRRIWKIYDKRDDHPEVVKELNNGTLTVTGAWKKITGIKQKEEAFQEHKDEFLKVISHVRREPLRNRLLVKYSNDRMIRKTSTEDLIKEIFRNMGIPIGETFQEIWADMCKHMIDAVIQASLSSDHRIIRKWFDGSRYFLQVTMWMDEAEGAQSLEQVRLKKSIFESFEEADAWAEEKGGFCDGLAEYGGQPYWRFMILKEKTEEDEN